MVLYHASRVSDLKILEPRAHKAVDGEKVVFASPDSLFCLAMTYGSGNTIAVSYFDDQDGRVLYLDELAPNAFEDLKNPASLYTVLEEEFAHDSRLKDEEYVAKKDVRVLSEAKIENVFDEIKKRGAQLILYDDVPASMRKRGKKCDEPQERYSEDRFA